VKPNNIYNITDASFVNIPELLKAMKSWVMWKRELVNGKWTKVPYRTRNYKARSTHPEDWTTFEFAIKALSKTNPDGTPMFDGIGFCVPIDGSLIIWGYDFDDAVNPQTSEFNEWRLPDGELAPVQPADILKLNTYTEYTPSGAGLRAIAICKGHVPGKNSEEYNERNPETRKIPGIEVYSEGRFFTFTGDVVEGAPTTVEERTAECDELYGRMFLKSQPAAGRKTSSPPPTPPFITKTGSTDLATVLVSGRIATESRNNLMFGLCGFLSSSAKWKRSDILDLLKRMIHMFHEADSKFDVAAQITKQTETLNTAYDRIVAGEKTATINYFRKLLKPEAFSALAKLESKSTGTTVESCSPQEMLNFLQSHPPESYANVPVEYWVEPHLMKGSLTTVTGAPENGKSTMVASWCPEIANAGGQVLYLDRDNPQFVAQERVKRLWGTTHSNIRYWGLWAKDQRTGLYSEPPHPTSPFLIEMVKRMNNPVIIFDTLASFLDGDENASEYMGVVFKAFRNLTTLGATVVCIHHPGKDPKSNSRGSSVIEGSSDVCWKVTGTHNADRRLTKITVSSFKTRLGIGKPTTYDMQDGVPVRRLKSETLEVQNRLLEILRTNPGLSKKKFEDHAIAANFRRDLVRDFVSNGVDCGVLRYENKKLYVAIIRNDLFGVAS
jgi:hypothetical protein